MFPAPAANRADFNAGAWSTGTCTPHLSRPRLMGLMGRPGVMPTRWASWSLTPGRAESALVWAANRATPLRMSVWMILPLGVLAATLVTPRSSSGWWTTSMSAPAATAASATSWVQSKARRIVSAGPAGSPQMRPTLSQLSARWGGYARSKTAIASATVVMCHSLSAVMRESTCGFFRTASRK